MALFGKRLTGVSGGTALGSAGVQWENIPTDKNLARRVLVDLEDRRLLFAHFSDEDLHECRSSAGSLRDFLGSIRKSDHIGKVLDRELAAAQRSLREFQQQIGHLRGDHVAPQDLIAPLSILRHVLGITIGDLAAQYNLEVSNELAEIVPDGNAWFFERVS